MRKIVMLFGCLALLSFGRLVSAPDSHSELNGNEISQAFDHSDWDRLLKRHVNAKGEVDYKGFAADRELLNSYLNKLSDNTPNESWTKAHKMAYYINAYNAFTIELILQNYPVNSIKDISSPWGKNFIPQGDKMISLDKLEHKILRKMGDPRIHFAINCASYSCPILLNEAYTPGRLEEQLLMATTRFINGPRNRLDPDNPKISAIFKWFKKDFVVDGQVDIVAFINQYAKIKITPGAKVGYLDYNWELNSK